MSRTLEEIREEIEAGRKFANETFAKIEAKDENEKLVHDDDAVQKFVDDLKENGRNLDTLLAEETALKNQIHERRETLIRERERIQGIAPAARGVSGPVTDPESEDSLMNFAEVFINGAVKSPSGNWLRSGEVEIPGMSDLVFKNAQPVGTADFETARPFRGVYGAIVQPPRFIELFPVETVDKLKFDWLLETLRSIAATGVAEDAVAPASDFSYTRQEVSLKRIRHITGITDDVLQSEGLLSAFINRNMVNGITEQGSLQTLSGSGVDNISGIVHRTGVQTNTISNLAGYTGPEVIDGIEDLMRLVLTNGRASPEAVALSPTIWSTVRTTKVGASDNRYAYVDPLQAGPATIWGRPVVETTEFGAPANDSVVACLGAFSTHAFIARMGNITLESTDSHGTEFAQWRNTLRAGVYMDLVCTRPQAFGIMSLGSA